MDRAQWNSACQSLVAAQQHFGVPVGAGHGSTLNNDGTPYQIALAMAGTKQAAKFIVDPSPQLPAEVQRKQVLNRIESWLRPGCRLEGEYLDRLSTLGTSEDRTANRFWFASNPQRTEVEVYTSLSSNASLQRINEFNTLMEEMQLVMPFSLDGFNIGPVSLTQNGTFTAYLRPTNLSTIVSIIPAHMADFLDIFSVRTVGTRGILISIKFNNGHYTGIKLDLCAHCVTPDSHSEAVAVNRLGRLFRDRPITLPADAKVAFWGVSYDGKAQRYYIYTIPFSHRHEHLSTDNKSYVHM